MHMLRIHLSYFNSWKQSFSLIISCSRNPWKRNFPSTIDNHLKTEFYVQCQFKLSRTTIYVNSLAYWYLFNLMLPSANATNNFNQLTKWLCCIIVPRTFYNQLHYCYSYHYNLLALQYNLSPPAKFQHIWKLLIRQSTGPGRQEANKLSAASCFFRGAASRKCSGK